MNLRGFNSSMASSSSDSKPRKTAVYDVFLSFRGDDTRMGFTSYVYDALVHEGYKTFFDDDNLVRGKAISNGLWKAIEDSKSSIIIFSENYAFSSWCLRELAKIVECMEKKGQLVLPIFYHVDPSHVRNQRESYRKAFEKHENNSDLNPMEVDSWTEALRQVGNLSGWHIDQSNVEAKFIRNFVSELSNLLDIPNRRSLESKKSETMAFNVFGKPITDSTLQAMPEYKGKEITATDRSRVAMKMIDAEYKDVNAKAFVDRLKLEYGNGTSTSCVIYNATGATLEHVGSKHWSGQIGKSPYPYKIENGQWGAFLHVHDSGADNGSIAATVYCGQNPRGTGFDWVLSWYNPRRKWWAKNKVYSIFFDRSFYVDCMDNLEFISFLYNLLKNAGGPKDTSAGDGCVSSVTIGSGTSPIVEGVLKLLDA